MQFRGHARLGYLPTYKYIALHTENEPATPPDYTGATMGALRTGCLLLLSLALLPVRSLAQLNLAQPAAPSGPGLTDPTFNTGVQPLLDADKRFAADVLHGGGAAFVTWLADDAVTLTSGKASEEGKAAIARGTTWKPEDYQLVWAPDGARMGPSGDAGVTWGTYQGHSRDHQGNPITVSGRYITVWKKDKAGQWKVLLDASNDAPPDAGSCCSVH
jgi:ketosteroid isomerase-like protein